MNNDGWTPERVELVKRTICPKGIGDDEFALFVEQCKRSGLDPLLKEAFCVPRRVNIGNKDKPNWVTKHEFQPSEAGMLCRAESMPDFRGALAMAVYAEDDIIINADAGEVKHSFNPAKRKGVLVGAWAKVLREGRVPAVVWLDFAAYQQSTPLWGKMPATMIEKCARAAGLRKAYPSQFGGMYVAGERPDDVDTGEETEAVVPIERPALSAPAPRETLEHPTLERVQAEVHRQVVERQQEVLGMAIAERTPGSDDDAPDDTENESLAIVHACEKVTTLEEYKPLRERAVKLPQGSAARKRASEACVRAHKRLTGGAK